MIEKLTLKLPTFDYQIIKQSIEIKSTSTFSIRSLLSIPSDGFLTLFPSGIRKVKDPMFVIKELLEILEDNKNHYVVLIGAKLDEELEQEIRQLTKEQERFYILDVINHDDFANVLRESNMVINTSISEGMSNVLMEAMYLGIPILARENDGNLKLVKHGYNGLIFRTPEEFKTLYNQLVCDNVIRQTIVQNAKTHIDEQYGLEKEVSLYENLLADTLRKYYFNYKGLKLYFPERVHPFSFENNDLFEVYIVS
jgi:glycosyltransferase involved in cell wall biosynthesis